LKQLQEERDGVVIKLLGEMTAEWEFDWCFIKETMVSLYTSAPLVVDKRCSIDLLTGRNDVRKVEKELERFGFVCRNNSRVHRIMCMTKSYQLPPYRRNYENIDLEVNINFDVLWGDYEGERISTESFLEDTVEIKLKGASLKVPSLSKAILELGLHYYQDMNSIMLIAERKSVKHKYFDHFYALINMQEPGADGELYELAERYRVVPYLYYMILYTGLIKKDEMMKRLIKQFQTSEGEKLLDCYGLTTGERKKWKIDFWTRLKYGFLYEFIKEELTEKDLKKIEANKALFF